MQITDDTDTGGTEELGSNAIVTDFSGDMDEGDLTLDDMTAAVDTGAEGTEDLAGQETPAQGQQPPAQTQTQTPPAGQQQQPAQGGSQPPAQAQQPGQTPQQPVDFEQYVSQNADALVRQLAEGPFRLSKEEAEAMGDAGKHVPQLLARAHLISTVQVMNALKQSLPTVVANLVQISNQSSSMEQEFFGQYPELASIDRKSLGMLGHALRQANPNMPKEQFMPMLAQTAATAFGAALKPVKGRAQPFSPAGASRSRGQPGAPQRRAQTVANDPLQAINAALMSGDE